MLAVSGCEEGQSIASASSNGSLHVWRVEYSTRGGAPGESCCNRSLILWMSALLALLLDSVDSVLLCFLSALLALLLPPTCTDSTEVVP